MNTKADVWQGTLALMVLPQRKFQTPLSIVFPASALLVATLGIYGVLAYSVGRRRNEIGVRMALGAQRSQLLQLVIRQGMRPAVLDLAAGIVAALVVARAIRGAAVRD